MRIPLASVATILSWLVTMPWSSAAPVHLVDERPVNILQTESGVYLVDFGRVAFGNVRLNPPAGVSGEVVVHFGEAFAEGRIDRNPPGTVRYMKTSVTVDGDAPVIAAPKPDGRNTQQKRGAILTPAEWGVVAPFRWLEIEGWDGELRPEHVTRQAAYAATWDDNAAAFDSSDQMLNQIWELCRYSIKATTFAGVYIDGDRERIPYEADAYLNQLSHYYCDHDVQMARDTFDHLMKHGTWPTEWTPHMVFMLHADWMRTGDVEWLAERYESVKSKLLLDRLGPDGLIHSDAQQIKRTDIVDWPAGERDRYEFKEINTVVNAFHLRAIALMIQMARGLGINDDVESFTAHGKRSYGEFQRQLFDAESGRYRDGVGTEHQSVHANLFPLAFGLAPESSREKIAQWLGNRGMRCSVYAAQYLMEAMFKNGADDFAVAMITAPHRRSWRNMVRAGTTITWEAWDQNYKPNQDWNHAWGAAPANLLPRYILGAEALTPGWEVARIRPCIGGLKYAKGKVPTPRGPIEIDWTLEGELLELSVALPPGMTAKIELPASEVARVVESHGQVMNATRVGDRLILDETVQGDMTFTVRHRPKRREHVVVTGPPANLIGHWKLDGNADDSVGSRDGLVGGIVRFIPGKIGRAATFESERGFISTSENPLPKTDFSIAAWVRLKSQSSDKSYIAGTQKSNQAGAFIRVEPDRSVSATVLPGGAVIAEVASIPGTITIGDWTHVAMTVSEADGLKLYVDGVLVGEDVSATSQIAMKNFTIGRRPDRALSVSDGGDWLGEIDDVAVWDGVLTNSQLKNTIDKGAAHFDDAVSDD
ncbi:Bacterial alpha-L-rhamnosidase [Planctomycetes bacterium CA13]|uniref:alpha-L-rhamnosidase n=1 Tax=Novipirellula herctigrandis TaxID=2527986 RepID=A0A5C5YVN3_9BACT|nr:Bacterial alpha-L-rhamnosidase [Planctomycetes bacterium CA13]